MFAGSPPLAVSARLGNGIHLLHFPFFAFIPLHCGMRSLRLHAKATRTCTNLVVVSLRKLHTPTTLVSHRLNAPSSPYIRRRGSSDLVPGGVKDDFVLWPNFFDFDQTKQLTIAALWKLDRSDSTRRRTRRPSESSRLGGNIELTAGSWAPLAAVFCGEYGFEKVCPPVL